MVLSSTKGRDRAYWILFVLLSVCLVGVFLIRMISGEMELSSSQVFLSLFFPDSQGVQVNLVVRDIRLPRLLASVGSGASLALSGVILQALLSNPLAEPYTLGIASGAAFGASLAILIGWYVSLAAFLGALGAMGLVSLLAWRSGGSSGHTILAGIVVGSTLSAGVTLAKALAGEKVGGIVFWLMGSFAGASWGNVLFVWGGVLVTLSAWWFSSDLDAISLGGSNPSVLGVEEKKLRALLLSSSALATASVVSSFGVIGFVGLVIPHLIRIIIGASHRSLIPLSFMAGGMLLSVADGFARGLGELPVGVLTSLVGGPFFCWILIKERGRS
nr:iron ABC transporter permease [uncultured Dethiosulfovibrio sp.]